MADSKTTRPVLPKSRFRGSPPAERPGGDAVTGEWRAELLQRLVWILAIFAVFYAIVFAFVLSSWFGAVALTAMAAIGLLAPAIYRRTGSLSSAAHFFACVIFAAVVTLINVTGGLNSPGMMWLAVVPMAATMLNGPRSGAIWVAVVALQVTLISRTDPQVYAGAQMLTPDGLKLLRTLSVTGLAGSVFACLSVDYINIAQANRHLHYQARHDGVTGLLNHRALLNLLNQSDTHDAARSKRSSLVLILLDVDYFKRVNDRFGHACGDRALKELARRVSRCVRASDHVGRYGGEEFLCILPDCPLESAMSIAESIRRTIGESHFDLGDVQIPVTASLGVAAYLPGEDRDALDTLRRADRALYRAKGTGRNRTRLDELHEPPSPPATTGLEPASAREAVEPDHEPVPGLYSVSLTEG
jgi:diguanylate cyclase (GGDEF)-like protein